MNRFFGLTVVLLLGALALPRVSPAAPTGMVELLNLTGGRQTAMGETTSLFDRDPFNLEYNPAAIVGLSKGQAGFCYTSLIQGRTTSTVALIFQIKGIDFGVHARLSSTGDIEARGETPTSAPDYLFSAHDFALRAYAAKRITPRLQAGVSAGWLMEKIDIYRANAVALGAGMIYLWDFGLAAHAAVANAGPQFTFRTEKNQPPTIYRAGIGFHRDQLTVNADYVSIKSGDSHIHFGAEYLLQQALFLRAGWQTGYDSRNFSAGAGFIYDMLRIDYAFVPYSSDLGNVHRFTLTIAFR